MSDPTGLQLWPLGTWTVRAVNESREHEWLHFKEKLRSKMTMVIVRSSIKLLTHASQLVVIILITQGHLFTQRDKARFCVSPREVGHWI